MLSRPKRRSVATDAAHQPARKGTKMDKRASPGSGDMYACLTSFHYLHLPVSKVCHIWAPLFCLQAMVIYMSSAQTWICWMLQCRCMVLKYSASC
jgi:hypothetical protein